MNFILRFVIFIMSFSCYADCFNKAGKDFGIDPLLLKAIAIKESSLISGSLNYVSHDSYALGLMQIHSQHKDFLAKLGISTTELRYNDCLNIYTGAFFLKKGFDKWGRTWRAVGAYNAGFDNSQRQEKKRYRYALDVRNIYVRLIRSE